MLERIKSDFFTQLLFSFINEEVKLKSIRYNKKLQQKININIMNYKLFTGKYIIYEEDGKGKEYNGYDDNLIFEGEILKGQRNGKGKEYYDNGSLKFEGEYKNGKRNGKGEEYYDCDYIERFEMEYVNGNRIRKSKEHYISFFVMSEEERLGIKVSSGTLTRAITSGVNTKTSTSTSFSELPPIEKSRVASNASVLLSNGYKPKAGLISKQFASAYPS